MGEEGEMSETSEGDLQRLERELAETAKRLLAKSKEREEAMAKPKYSVEIIRRYREMDRAGEFMRGIQERIPVSLNADEVLLSCGHKREVTDRLIDAMPNGMLHCYECRDQWLAKAVEEQSDDDPARST
jgi:hypothetical protein